MKPESPHQDASRRGLGPALDRESSRGSNRPARVRAALYALIYVALCGVALSAMPREAAASIPHNGSLPPPKSVFLPAIYQQGMADAPEPCPTASNLVYEAVPIPVEGPRIDRPPAINGDVNLALRSYVQTDAFLGLIDLDGDADANAPQIADMLSPGRLPAFVAAYRVYDWDWQCAANGCRGQPLDKWPVTLIALDIAPGTPLAAPSRRAEIHAGGYVAFVLYAEERRITLHYRRQDSIVQGYTVHMEDICVDANLLALYRQLDDAGRRSLPALRNNEPLGSASSVPPKIAVRDTGEFMDPRSRKDWWQGY